MGSIYPLSYSICSEDVVEKVGEKKHVWAEVIPGYPETYRFGAEDEGEYKSMYRESMFGQTSKKGGWDCLRHYEILSNGCIPYFKDIEKCPEATLHNFPKELIKEANKCLIPWKGVTQLYEYYANKLLEYTRKHLTAERNGEYFMKIVNEKNIATPKILFIRCDAGVNYTREFLFIGVNRVLKEKGGECIVHPQIEYLYCDYDKSGLKGLHGMGYGYGRRLEKTQEKEKRAPSEEEIKASIESHYWDFIVYGKVGVDEGYEGTIPRLPYWKEVSSRYGKEELVFLYGGDGMQDFKSKNTHSRHLIFHAQYGKCFVRELND